MLYKGLLKKGDFMIEASGEMTNNEVKREEFAAFLHCTFQTIKFAPKQKYDAVVEYLCDAYFEPHRSYHGACHIMDYVRYLRDMREHFHDESVEPLFTYEVALFAAMFHDVVYQIEDPSQNESLSAMSAMKWAKSLGFDNHFCGSIVAAILFTVSDTPRGSHLPEPLNVFLDGDNLWLMSQEAFDEANARIVEEYSNFYDVEEVRAGRRVFLKRYLEESGGVLFRAQINRHRNGFAQKLLTQNGEENA
jgi:predicted metal-dependent HD superfamily phosphohydrolase